MTVPRRTRMNSLLLISAAVVVVWALVVSADHYKKCPDGLMYVYPVLTAVRGQSRLACAVLCSTDIRCKAVNVCPDRLMPSRVMCDLLASQNPGRCESGLETASSPSCAYLHKVGVCTCTRPFQTHTVVPSQITIVNICRSVFCSVDLLAFYL